MSSDSTPHRSFWLLGDDQLDLATHVHLRPRLYARLVQAIIFEGPVVTSDANLMNNWNLRRLLQDDPRAMELVTHKYLSFTVRERRGVRRSLVDLHKEFTDSVPVKRPPHFPEQEYRDAALFERIESLCSSSLSSFDGASVGSAFEAGVRKSLASSVAREFLETQLRAGGYNAKLAEQTLMAARDLAGQLRDKKLKDRHGQVVPFGLNYFYYRYNPTTGAPGLGAHLEEMMPGLPWGVLENAIRDITRGAYLTALPDLLEQDPIYEMEHRKAIEILREQRFRPNEEVVRIDPLSLSLSLAEFESLLGLVEARHIETLHESQAWKEFQNALRSYGRPSDAASVVRQFYIYRTEVEVTLARILGFRLKENGAKLKSEVRSLLSEGGEGVVSELLADLAPLVAAPLEVVLQSYTLIQRLRRRSPEHIAANKAQAEADRAYADLQAAKVRLADTLPDKVALSYKTQSETGATEKHKYSEAFTRGAGSSQG